MTEGQLNNIIYFCFNFHYSYDSKLYDNAPEYLLEKWNKYIGFKPKSIDLNLPHILNNKHLYRPDLIRWIEKWDRNSQFESVKEILNIIILLNERYLGSANELVDKYWTLSELIELFENIVGDINNINKEHYRHIHILIERSINEWKSNPINNREFTINTIIN